VEDITLHNVSIAALLGFIEFRCSMVRQESCVGDVRPIFQIFKIGDANMDFLQVPLREISVLCFSS